MLFDSKMDDIDLESHLKSAPEKWRRWMLTLPEILQREFADERPDPNQEDIDAYTKLKLHNGTPMKMKITELLKSQSNVSIIATTPKEIVEKINSIWRTDVVPGKVYDQHPDRYEKYSKMLQHTVKPSVMINGRITFGCGRFIAALLRGDEYLQVWDLRG